jgi:antirestriction protein ArdC
LPDEDLICLPDFEAFFSAFDYYSVRAHETTHWTGASHRLNRDLKNRFGPCSEAFEELIAELGAAFLCSILGISNEPRPNHAAYLAHWLYVLKNDKRAIFTAASKAQQAVDYMLCLERPGLEAAA